jgi:pimeloyl-ACP methyl ester carboxylesterase
MAEQPLERRVAVNGVELAVYEWPGDGPPLLLAHATSFHGRCWDPVAELLPGRRRVAFDHRGHGRSAKPEPPYRWADFGADTAALAAALDLRGAVAVGHSLGGYAATLAAALAPGRLAALLLLDPVILAPERYVGRTPGAHGAARRRAHWSSPRAFYERLHDRPPFSRWQPAALHAYCDHGLLRNPAGHDYVLACPPAVEADIYQGATERPLYAEIAALKIPAVVVRGHPYQDNPAEDLSASPTFPGLAGAFPNGRDVFLPDHDHFIPMVDPALVARMAAELAGAT